MMLTDREWLRFVTFALVAGSVLGSIYTGALIVRGHSLTWTVIGGILSTGAIAIIVHLTMRYLLDRASEPPADEPDPEGETA